MSTWKISLATLGGCIVVLLIGYGVFVAVGATGSFVSLKGLGLTIIAILFLLACLARALFQADDLLLSRMVHPGSVIGSVVRPRERPVPQPRDEPPWQAGFDDGKPGPGPQSGSGLGPR